MALQVGFDKSSVATICLFMVVAVDGTQNVQQHKYKLIQSCPLLPTENFKRQSSHSLLGCIRLCSRDVNCQSASFHETSKDCYIFSDFLNCMLKSSDPELMHAMRVESINMNVETTTTSELTTQLQGDQSTSPTCLNFGTLNETTQTCSCYSGYVGDRCERLMKDCTEGFQSGHYNEHVFFISKIKPDLAPTSFDVICYMKNHGGTTLIMRNSKWAFNPDFNRNLNWDEYKNGFGEDLPGNHWIGLDKIHYITSSRPQHLFIEIIAITGGRNSAWRKYEHFRVEDESTNYRMTYSGSFPWSQNDVNADPDWNQPIENTPLGDSMIGLNGSAFSTYDRDNDQDPGRNCAQDYKGGWWFNACAECNPNGPLKSPRTTSAVDELFWKYDYMDYETGKIYLMLRAS